MSIKWVEGKGWVHDSGMVLNSPEHKAQQKKYTESVKQFQDGVGKWGRYRNGTIADLADKVNGDHWWYTRLHSMSDQVANGDMHWFNQSFPGRYNVGEGRSHDARELVNRYLALRSGGHSDAEIMRGIYGDKWGEGKASDWNYNNNTTYASGGGMLSGFINLQPRAERKGAWGDGYTNGGYGLLGEENQAMRNAIGEQLEKKLLG